MKSTISQRVKIVVDNYATSISDFAKKIKTNRQDISDITLNRKKLTIKIAEILHDQFNINLNWLICGEGEMYVGDKKGSGLNVVGSDIKMKEIAHGNSNITKYDQNSRELLIENEALKSQLESKEEQIQSLKDNLKTKSELIEVLRGR